MLWFRIGDIARELDLETYVVRYWDDEFRAYLKTRRTKSNQRWYGPADMDVFREVYRLLRTELYTIAGAKRQLRLKAEREREAG